MLFVLSYFVGDPTHGIYPPRPREQNTSSVCLLLGTIIFIWNKKIKGLLYNMVFSCWERGTVTYELDSAVVQFTVVSDAVVL